MLEVLKLFIEARDAPVKEVHFEGTPRPVVRDHDHVGDQQGGRRSSSASRTRPASAARPRRPRTPVSPEAAPDESGVDPGARAKKAKRGGGGRPRRPQLIETTYGKELAKRIRARKVKLPIYYPTVLETGTEYAQKPRVYKINGTGDGSPAELRARRLQVGLLAPGAGRVLRLHGDPLEGPADPQEPLRGARDRRPHLQALLRRRPPADGRLAGRRGLLLALATP